VIDEHGVVVAGAGPVGLTLAVALAREGVPVTVLEAGRTLSTTSKASTFHPPTLEMLDELGVAETLIERGVIAPRYQLRDRHDGIYAEFDLGLLSDLTRYPFRVQYEQHRLTPLLMDRLRETPDSQVRFDHKVVGVSQDRDGVTVRALGADGRPTRLRARWLVGADGASSAVRKTLYVPFEGMTYPVRYLVVTTKFDFAEHLDGLANVNYVSDPDEWFTLLRLPDVWRAMFPTFGGLPDAAAMDAAAVQRRLRGVVPDTDGDVPVEHTTLYRVHQRVASGFRHRRVLLAGDAAHINNPLGGMGMNCGLHDAISLARRLGSVWHGRATEGTLDEYARIRRAVAIDYVKALSDANFSQIQQSDPSARRREQEHMRRIAEDPATAREFLVRNTLMEALERFGDPPCR
jgi:3-(3-hydroxy-phenyl)propionate hydroxylase